MFASSRGEPLRPSGGRGLSRNAPPIQTNRSDWAAIDIVLTSFSPAPSLPVSCERRKSDLDSASARLLGGSLDPSQLARSRTTA